MPNIRDIAVDTTLLYRFEWAKKRLSPVLVDVKGKPWIVERVGKWQPTSPLQKPDLFRVFGAIATPADALAFARRHGLLGATTIYQKDKRGRPSIEDAGDERVDRGLFGKLTKGATPAEPLDVWLFASRRMGRAVALLDAIRTGRPAPVGPWLSVEEPRGQRGSALRLEWGDEGGWVRPELGALADSKRPLWNARLALQDLVNSTLTKHAAPRLLLDPKRERQVVGIVPRTLLGAMWCQVAQAVEEVDATYRRCASCLRWMLVSARSAPGARRSRSDQTTCSDGCRQDLHRARRKTRRSRRGLGYGEGTAKVSSTPKSKRRRE